MPFLNDKEDVIDNLVNLNKALTVVPRHITTFGAQWYLAETVLNRSFPYKTGKYNVT